MFRSRSCMTAIVVAMLGTSAGCGASGFSAFDKIAFWRREVVPQHILDRHGPTAADRLADIDNLGRRAAKASAEQQQAFSMQVAEQIKQEGDPVVRQHLIHAIAKCRTATAGAILHAGLGDDDLDVQLAACAELKKWENPRTTAVLGEIVADDDKPVDLRLAAIETLSKFKDRGVADQIAPALQSNADPALQYRAVKSLAKVTGLDYGNDLIAWRKHFGTPNIDDRREQIAVPNFAPTNRQVGFEQ